MQRWLFLALVCVTFCVSSCYDSNTADMNTHECAAGYAPEASLNHIRIRGSAPQNAAVDTITVIKGTAQRFTVDGFDRWDCPAALDYARVTWDVSDEKRFSLQDFHGIMFVTGNVDLFDVESRLEPGARLNAHYGRLSAGATLVGIVNLSGEWLQDFTSGKLTNYESFLYGRLTFDQNGRYLFDTHNGNVIGVISDTRVNVVLANNVWVDVQLASRTTALGTYQDTCQTCPPMGTAIWARE